MKNILLMLIALFAISQVNAQPWLQNLSNTKATHTLTDYQNAFNTYWAPYNVSIDGTYTENGVVKKAAGWKQFKRWEWDMKSQVNPISGELPTQSAMEIYNSAIQNGQIQSLINNTNSWTSIGPSSSAGGYAGIGRVNCIAFHPTNNNIYWVGTPEGGLWKTSNNGSSWTCLTDSNDILGVSSIIIPSNYATTNTIYIATGDRDKSYSRSIGVLKSTDGGATWNTTGLSYSLSQNKKVYKLLLDPSNNNTLLAATSSGVYKTTNGGTTWNTQLTSASFMDMEYKPGSTSTIYGSTYYGDVYRTTNSGSTWTKTLNTSGLRAEIAVSASNSSIVYAMVANNSDYGLLGIYKSTNSGATFTNIYNSTNLMGWKSNGSDAGGQGWYDVSIDVSPTDANKVIVGGVNSHRSTNGGTSWSCSNCWTGYTGYNFGNHPVVHADKHNLTYRSNGDLFECNDGGVYISTNNGSSWTDKSNGLTISQMYKLGTSKTNSTETITGLQDNGSKLFYNNTWSDAHGGDGMECLIDYTNDQIQYATTQKGNIYLTTDRWSSSTNIKPSNSGNGAWVTPYIIDPVNHSTIYAGYADVWKSTNKGTSWTKISTMNTSSKLECMAIAPSNTSVLYVADYNTLWKTTNGGTAWTTITTGLPVSSGDITSIAVKHNDANTVWVTIGGYNNSAVYKTSNGGTSWTSISTGLPSVPALSIIQDKTITTDEVLYLGTQLGVYIKVGAANWVEYNLSFPKVKIGELEIYYDASNPTNNKLRAATYGRGLWEVDLYVGSSLLLPIANFGSDKTSICTDDTINFTDSTTNNPTSWAWTFSPSNVTYINSTNSSSQNPEIKFSNSGIYSVSLTATNADGNDTKTINGFIKVGGAQTPFTEGFEAGSTTLGDWRVSNYDSGSITWGLANTSGNGSSTRSVYMDNYGYNAAGDVDDLIMPLINLENLSSASLKFKHAYTRYSGYPSDTLFVYISTNCGATLTILDTLAENGSGNFATAPDTTYGSSSNFVPAASSDWCGSSIGASCDSIDLSSYVNNDNVYIIFRSITAYSNNLYLDDIQIIGSNSTNLIASFTAANSTLCTGVSTTFTNTSQNATSYVWKQDNVIIGTTQNLTKTFATGGTFEIRLIASDGTNLDSTSQLITVNASPTQASTPSGASTACTNNTNSIYTTTGANFATSYTWSISPSSAGSISGTGLTASIIWNNSFSGNADINVYGTNSCGMVPYLLHLLLL